MINIKLRQLEELTYIKSAEVDQQFGFTCEKLLGFSKENKFIEAVEKFNYDFHSLKDEKSSLLFGDSLNEIKNTLEQYYTRDIAEMCPITGQQITKYFPHSNLTLVAQYLFAVHLNPNSSADKRKASSFADNSNYSQTHSSYHYYFENICSKLGARDLYLIDPLSGDVIYSICKNIDFGANLYNGRLRGSSLSTAFRKALAANMPVVSFVDYSSYAPAFDQPVAFLSTPVYSDNKLIGVVVIQLGSGFLEHILYDEYMLATEGSFEYTLVGNDMFLRNNPRGFLRDELGYLHNLEKHAGRRDINRILLYKKTHNMAMFAQYPVQSRIDLLSKQNIQIIDYNGNKVLASTRNIDILGSEFIVIGKMNRAEALSDYFKLIGLFLIVFALLLIGTYLTGKYFAETLKNRITRLRDAMINLYKGEQPKVIDAGSHDEIGETVAVFNNLRTRVNETSEFAIEMSEGNFNHEFAIFDETDSFGKSLNVLKVKMINSKEEQVKRQKEDEIRNWLNTGIAKFNDLLRQNNNNIEALSYSLIENLVNYLGANQGGVFLVEGEGTSEKHIRLVASYAYDRRKYNQKIIEIGEGLLGNIYLEKRPIYLKDIPEDYMEIKSGLGQSSPRCLYIAPLKVDENVLGMIEIASLNELAAHHLELFEKISESIAGTFISVRLNMQTTLLLEESNRRTEEITQQEEEMRQNLEEMQATQEELARLRQSDENRTREMQIIIDNSRRTLKNMLDAIPGGYVLKDPNGIILLANREGAEYYGLSVESVVGKTDYELLSSAQFEAEHKADFDVISKGEKQYSETKEIGSDKKKYNVIKKPFLIEETQQPGILTIRFQAQE